MSISLNMDSRSKRRTPCLLQRTEAERLAMMSWEHKAQKMCLIERKPSRKVRWAWPQTLGDGFERQTVDSVHQSSGCILLYSAVKYRMVFSCDVMSQSVCLAAWTKSCQLQGSWGLKWHWKAFMNHVCARIHDLCFVQDWLADLPQCTSQQGSVERQNMAFRTQRFDVCGLSKALSSPNAPRANKSKNSKRLRIRRAHFRLQKLCKVKLSSEVHRQWQLKTSRVHCFFSKHAAFAVRSGVMLLKKTKYSITTTHNWKGELAWPSLKDRANPKSMIWGNSRDSTI